MGTVCHILLQLLAVLTPCPGQKQKDSLCLAYSNCSERTDLTSFRNKSAWGSWQLDHPALNIKSLLERGSCSPEDAETIQLTMFLIVDQKTIMSKFLNWKMCIRFLTILIPQRLEFNENDSEISFRGSMSAVLPDFSDPFDIFYPLVLYPSFLFPVRSGCRPMWRSADMQGVWLSHNSC